MRASLSARASNPLCLSPPLVKGDLGGFVLSPIHLLALMRKRELLCTIELNRSPSLIGEKAINRLQDIKKRKTKSSKSSMSS